MTGNIQIGNSRHISPVKSDFLINIFRYMRHGEQKHGDSSIISWSIDKGG